LGLGTGGGVGGLMTGRGAANALTRTTVIFAAIFISTSIALALVAKRRDNPLAPGNPGTTLPAAPSTTLLPATPPPASESTPANPSPTPVPATSAPAAPTAPVPSSPSPATPAPQPAEPTGGGN
jgi:preprotein translocase subunit SecG